MDEATIQLKYLAAKDLPGTIVYWGGPYSPFVGNCAARRIEDPGFGDAVHTTGDPQLFPCLVHYPSGTRPFHPSREELARIDPGNDPELNHWVCYGCGREVLKHYG